MVSGRAHSVETKEKAICMRKDGLQVRDIGDKLGVNEVTLSCWFKKEGLTNPQIKWTNDSIIEAIKLRVVENKSLKEIIVQKEDGKLLSIAVYKFGSWSSALEKAGMNSVEIINSHKYIAVDEKYYDSSEEARAANFLYALKVDGHIDNYKSHVLVKSDRKWTCDFLVHQSNKPPLWIEYDGCGSLRRGRGKESFEEKIQFMKESNFSLEIVKSLDELKYVFPKTDIDKSRIEPVRSLGDGEFKNAIIKDVRRVALMLDKAPNKKEYDQYGKTCCSLTACNRFDGTWKSVIEKSGFEYKRVGEHKKFSNEIMLSICRDIANGESVKDICKRYDIGKTTIKRRIKQDRLDLYIDNIKRFRNVQDECLQTFIRKNYDYDSSFDEHGIVGVIMRMGDKLKRMMSITSKSIALVNDESLRDTLLDLHNYAAMAIMLLNEKNEDDTEANNYE